MEKQKTFKQLIEKFDINKPNFSELIPYLTGDLEDNLEGFKGNLIGKWGAIKTLWQLSRPEKPQSRSRMWQSPRAYRFLVQWTNAVLFRILIRKFTATLPQSEYRTKTQLDDAGRSVVSNIEEGFKRPTTSSYLDFLGFSQASLEEANGLTHQCLQDGFLKSVPGSSLKDLGIDLKAWNNWAKNSLNSLPAQAGSRILYFPLQRNKGGYRTLKDIKGQDISYEILMELINKTDWNLRKLVESLEKKLDDERQFYKVEQLRIKDKAKGSRK